MCTLFCPWGNMGENEVENGFRVMDVNDLRYIDIDTIMTNQESVIIMIITIIMGTVGSFSQDLYQHQDTETGP